MASVTCLQLSDAALTALTGAGWVKIGGPFKSLSTCNNNCPSAGGVVTVTQDTANLCTTDTTLTIQGSGFDVTCANNFVTLTDAGGVTIPYTIASCTTLSLVLTLTSPPIPTLGALTAIVSNSGGTSGTAVQVATVTECTTGPCACYPLPNTVTATFTNLADCACADAVSTTLTLSGGQWSSSFSICGVTVQMALGCITIGGINRWGLSILSGGVRLDTYATVISCSALHMTARFNMSTIPGLCGGVVQVDIT